MSMVVRNNLSAVNTLNTLNRNQTELSKSLQQVSSGMRINSAKDDASGYAISERMRVQIRSLNQDNMNTQNGNSMMRVAEGAVQSTVDILKTLKEKVIDAANDTNTDADRAFIQKELDQSIDQINDNANVTYNGKYLVDGSKNAKSDGTFTALTNSSLSEDTTSASRLVKLKDRTGNDLNIQIGDQLTVSYVKQGKTYSTSFAITNATSIASVLTKAESLSVGTFANAANASIVAVKGESDIEEQIRQAKQALDDAADALTVARGNLAASQATYNQYETLRQTAVGKLSTVTSKSQDSTMLAWIDATKSLLGWTGDFTTQYQQWTSRDLVTFGSSSIPNPSNASATNYDTLGNVITLTTPSQTAEFRTAFGEYSAAYTNLANAESSNPYSARLADLNAKKSAMNAAQSDFDDALAAYEAIAGPVILDGPEVGKDYFGNVQETADKKNAITITAEDVGTEGQISGFTLSVTDNMGKIKKSVNAALDAWTETIRAENEHVDDDSIVLQIGTKANQAINIRLTDMRAVALGLQGTDGTTLNVSTQQNANAAINVLDTAIQKALDQQTAIGAVQSRLEYTSTNLVIAIENVQASESAVRDADMAQAMTEYTKNNVLLLAAQSMLAQANQNSTQVLMLLR